MFDTAEEAIEFYGKKRFQHGVGITQPCQLRYVKYFEQILKGNISSPTVKLVRHIEMNSVPNIKNKT
jgi:phosphatidylinositol-3,4,5-trisphosphate 3-phosphatase/dual-specificity protein phosphatase PTEN